MKKILLVIFILSVLFLVGCVAKTKPSAITTNYNAPENHNTILNVLVREEGWFKKPIPEAIVYLGNAYWQCRTNSQGKCTISEPGFVPGDYGLGVYKDGYDCLSSPEKFVSGDNFLTLELVPIAKSKSTITNDCSWVSQVKTSKDTHSDQDVSITDFVPSEMTYVGTKYVNCYVDNRFPVVPEHQNLTSLTGIAKDVGRMHPLVSGIIIGDIVLFNGATMDKFTEELNTILGQEITFKGYYGNKTFAERSYGYTSEIFKYTPFYITDIPGWHYVCCDATLEDTGRITTPNVCYWFKK